MPRFSTGQAKEPDKLNQFFSFTGKVRAADVLHRMVEVCGYDRLRQKLNEWEAAELPAPKRRKAKKVGSTLSE